MTALSKRRVSEGFFVVFEGLDGAGKTTQIRLLETHLRHAGYSVVSLKEPTDGPWGQKLRQLVHQGRQGIAPATELEWFLQDRREDVERNIRPALAGGQIVLLDRYYFSTMAYQGALGCDPETIRQRHERFAPPPHLLFLLEISPSQGLQRVQEQRQLDSFERLEYLEQVAAIFAGLHFPYLRRIQATLELQAVHAQICREVRQALAQRQIKDEA